MELLVRTRNGTPSDRRRAMNSPAPGIGFSSRTSTPSMSISHEWISRLVMSGRIIAQRPVAAGAADATAGRSAAGSDGFEVLQRRVDQLRQIVPGHLVDPSL